MTSTEPECPRILNDINAFLLFLESDPKETSRRLSKSSILYESSDPRDRREAQQHHSHYSQNDNTPSKTLVQGGQGGRRWSHELSPEKAGLVGSVLEVAGLLKDVVLDTIQQHPPSSASSSSTTAPPSSSRPRLGLTPEEKLEAAKVAFGGGSEEAGDQTIYLDGLEEHLRHENAKRSTAEAAAASPATTSLEARDLLVSAHDVAQEHHRSIFHLAANPEVRKSMLLDHPESLGYHARDPTLAPFEESALPTAQHRPARTHGRQEDLSTTSR